MAKSMNEEECKELGSSALRKTLKELNISTLDALGATICVLKIMFEFSNELKNPLELDEFFQKNKRANESVFILYNVINLMEKFEENFLLMNANN